MRKRVDCYRAIAVVFLLTTLVLEARAGFYGRGPIEDGEYVATFVEDIRFPRFSNGVYLTFIYSRYENGAPFYSGLAMKGEWQKFILQKISD